MSAERSPLRDRLVFLVGARRSGTNWLERILTTHPDVVAMPSETYLFSHGLPPLVKRFQHASPSSSLMGQTFMERERFFGALRRLLDEVFLDNLERLGPDARYLVERTPSHASHLSLIAAVYPDARVIHIVRDGRAVARSLVSMEWGPRSIEEAAEEWRDSVEGGRAGRKAFGDRYLEIGYERLSANPRERTGEIFDWLGLELDDATWDRILLEASSEFNVDPGSPGVRTDKWRDELSDSDVRAFERVAGAQLEACGYPLAASTRASSPGLRERARALRGLARTVRRPRAVAGAARRRSLARRERRELQENFRVADGFGRVVERGEHDRALALFADRAWVRISDNGAVREGRGLEMAREALAALSAHLARGLRPLNSEMHASPAAFTTVDSYELADGSRWSRTVVLHVRGGRIIRLALHRVPVHM